MCYGTFTDVFNQSTGEVLTSLGESGCTFGRGRGAVVERDLSTATIAPTTITLETFSCDEIECGPTGETRDAFGRGILHGDLGCDPLVIPQCL